MIFKDGVGRKFIVCAMLMLAHYGALFYGIITPQDYTSLLYVVLGVFVGGNLGERVIEKRAVK